jgi:nitrite reductase/ring-hydroxylating ferredoxin subunit/alkylhydroperoxidase/carboxymuconolactone decarboxylase family protein YurZ
MSEALEYLVKVRPEAMGAYFKFLKEAGSRLDVKTRDLISVITKVHSQTERGLKQYVTRALRDGCTPAEIVDALLMAFPALGLAKIVWATDVLLAMKLPGFAPEEMDRKKGWHDLGAAKAFKAGKAAYVTADGRNVFVYRGKDGVRVYDALCPHQVTRIPELALKGGTLTCPKHNWAFDIRTGACIAKGDRPLTRFEHKVEKGRLLAFW